MLQKCKDAKCTKCAQMIPNPYGYKPNMCQNDYLKVVCTNQPMPENKKVSVENSAKARLASMKDGAKADPVSVEQSAKNRIAALKGAAPAPPSAEKTAKDRLKALKAGAGRDEL